MSQQGYKKPYTKAATSAPVARSEHQTSGGGKGSKPTYVIKMSAAKGEKMVRLTGLFANESKNGQTYYSGSVREEIVIPAGAKILLMTPFEE